MIDLTKNLAVPSETFSHNVKFFLKSLNQESYLAATVPELERKLQALNIGSEEMSERLIEPSQHSAFPEFAHKVNYYFDYVNGLSVDDENWT
jgi:hypothetical protein